MMTIIINMVIIHMSIIVIIIRSGEALLRAKDCTPKITKVKFHWKMPRTVHWTIPVKIHRESDNPLANTTDK